MRRMAKNKLSTKTTDSIGTSSTKVIEILAILIDGNILALGGIADYFVVYTPGKQLIQRHQRLRYLPQSRSERLARAVIYLSGFSQQTERVNINIPKRLAPEHNSAALR